MEVSKDLIERDGDRDGNRSPFHTNVFVRGCHSFPSCRILCRPRHGLPGVSHLPEPGQRRAPSLFPLPKRHRLQPGPAHVRMVVSRLDALAHGLLMTIVFHYFACLYRQGSAKQCLLGCVNRCPRDSRNLGLLFSRVFQLFCRIGRRKIH